MPKYHITEEDFAAPCNESLWDCPLGVGAHFDTMKEAAVSIAERVAEREEVLRLMEKRYDAGTPGVSTLISPVRKMDPELVKLYVGLGIIIFNVVAGVLLAIFLVVAAVMGR